MKLIYTSALALSFFAFSQVGYASQNELVVEKLSDQAIAEEMANTTELQAAVEGDESGTLTNDDQAIWRDHRGGWNQPNRHPGRPLYRSCFAKNGRGELFRASGFFLFSGNLQRQALSKCRNNSRNPYSCRAVGCR